MALGVVPVVNGIIRGAAVILAHSDLVLWTTPARHGGEGDTGLLGIVVHSLDIGGLTLVYAEVAGCNNSVANSNTALVGLALCDDGLTTSAATAATASASAAAAPSATTGRRRAGAAALAAEEPRPRERADDAVLFETIALLERDSGSLGGRTEAAVDS